MALPTSFINTSRSRVSAFLKALEDLKSLQDEFTALGGTTFTNGFDFSGENASAYDLTQAEYNTGLAAISEVITAANGGAVSANAARLGAIYKIKA